MVSSDSSTFSTVRQKKIINSFVRFLEESEDTKKSFQNYLTFSLSELKVTPSFCFPFKIPDDPTASNMYKEAKLVVIKQFFLNIPSQFFFALIIETLMEK